MFDFLKKSKTASGSASQSSPAASPVDSIRRQAQARLIGSLMLVGVAVVGFPMVFDTEPRPLDPSIPVVVQKAAEAAAPVVEPVGGKETASAPAEPVIASADAAATPATTSSAPTAAAGATPATTPGTIGPVASSSKALSKVDNTPKVSPKADDGAKALALLEGKTPDTKAAKPASGDSAAATGKRFVVQAGSFSDKAAIRDARAKLERAGYKTYAQEITRDGKPITRVRVGPFPSEEEARKVLARIKSLGFKPGLLEI
ncbi:MAG: hypothetical protein RLZZ397_362 [Pseudomonadota bacterium]